MIIDIEIYIMTKRGDDYFNPNYSGFIALPGIT